jgi:hypothetical protein
MSCMEAWESRLFPDIYDTVEATHRVKYGVLNAVNDPPGAEPTWHHVAMYGPFHVMCCRAWPMMFYQVL